MGGALGRKEKKEIPRKNNGRKIMEKMVFPSQVSFFPWAVSFFPRGDCSSAKGIAFVLARRSPQDCLKSLCFHSQS